MQIFESYQPNGRKDKGFTTHSKEEKELVTVWLHRRERERRKNLFTISGISFLSTEKKKKTR